MTASATGLPAPGRFAAQMLFGWAEEPVYAGRPGWDVIEIIDIDHSAGQTIATAYKDLFRGRSASADSLLVVADASGLHVARRFGGLTGSDHRAQAFVHVLVGLDRESFDLAGLLGLEDAPFWRHERLQPLALAEVAAADRVARGRALDNIDPGPTARVLDALLNRNGGPVFIRCDGDRHDAVRAIQIAYGLLPSLAMEPHAVSTFEPTPNYNRSLGVSISPEAQLANQGTRVDPTRSAVSDPVLHYVEMLATVAAAQGAEHVELAAGDRRSMSPAQLGQTLKAEFSRSRRIGPAPGYYERRLLTDMRSPETFTRLIADDVDRDRLVDVLTAGEIDGPAPDFEQAAAAISGSRSGVLLAQALLVALSNRHVGDDRRRWLAPLTARLAGDKLSRLLNRYALDAEAALALLHTGVPSAGELGDRAGLVALAGRTSDGAEDVVAAALVDPAIADAVFTTRALDTAPNVAVALMDKDAGWLAECAHESDVAESLARSALANLKPDELGLARQLVLRLFPDGPLAHHLATYYLQRAPDDVVLAQHLVGVSVAAAVRSGPNDRAVANRLGRAVCDSLRRPAPLAVETSPATADRRTHSVARSSGNDAGRVEEPVSSGRLDDSASRPSVLVRVVSLPVAPVRWAARTALRVPTPWRRRRDGNLAISPGAYAAPDRTTARAHGGPPPGTTMPGHPRTSDRPPPPVEAAPPSSVHTYAQVPDDPDANWPLRLVGFSIILLLVIAATILLIFGGG